MALPGKAPAAGSWGKFIPAQSPWLRVSGRVDFNGHEARFDWAQVSFHCDFEGKACAVYLDPGDNNFNLFVDGELKAILGPKPKDPEIPGYSLWLDPLKNEVRIWVLSGLSPGKHRLELNKRTGANFNHARFYGLRLDSKARPLRPSPAFKRRIEFIGDSLSNAYGCEAPTKECPELRPYENGWKSYAAIAARELKAELQMIALSGYGVVRNYGEAAKTSAKPMPYHYSHVISGEDKIIWDRKKFVPDAIVVNLGTNDYSTEPSPDKQTFVDGYLDLLDAALEGRKKTPIFVISVKGEARQVKAVKLAAKTAQLKGLDVTLLEFEKAGEHELGCDWHPQAKVHERWALVLEDALRRKLNW